MYPKISDFINDILGTHICLPIQSFGFFVALCFIVVFYVLKYEMKRKQNLGLFPSRPVKVLVGGEMPLQEVISTSLLWALLGYKFGLAFESYSTFCDSPQKAFLSLEGSPLGALIFALIGGGYAYWQYSQRKGTKQVEELQQHSIGEDLGTIMTIAFVAGILGAKIFHNLENWDTFVKDPVGSLVSFDGLTFYGGLICAATILIVYIIKRGYPIWEALDTITPTLLLGYGIGRIGCHIAGDGDWGVANPNPNPFAWLPDWAWAYGYPHNVIGEGVPIAGCSGPYCAELIPPVFPTPLYEAIAGIALFAILWAMRDKTKYLGQLTGLYLIFNGLERFFIEKIRVNNLMNFLGMQITQAELISSIIFLTGVGVLIWATFIGKKRREPMFVNG